MKNSKESAFGYGYYDPKHYERVETPGLTKREYLAGLAMQGILSNAHMPQPYLTSKDDDFKNFSKTAVRFADELLKELEKSEKP